MSAPSPTNPNGTTEPSRASRSADATTAEATSAADTAPDDTRGVTVSPSRVTVSPAPSDEEVAAIMAAMEALWPRPVLVEDPRPAPRRAGWRFSGRWWALPLPVRRNRPWH